MMTIQAVQPSPRSEAAVSNDGAPDDAFSGTLDREQVKRDRSDQKRSEPEKTNANAAVLGNPLTTQPPDETQPPDDPSGASLEPTLVSDSAEGESSVGIVTSEPKVEPKVEEDEEAQAAPPTEVALAEMALVAIPAALQAGASEVVETAEVPDTTRSSAVGDSVADDVVVDDTVAGTSVEAAGIATDVVFVDDAAADVERVEVAAVAENVEGVEHSSESEIADTSGKSISTSTPADPSIDAAKEAMSVAAAQQSVTPARAVVETAAPQMVAAPHSDAFDMSKLGEGIASRLRSGEKVQSLTLELHPAELGGVRVDVRQIEGVTHLVLTPDRLTGGHRLAAAMADLRHDLDRAGVNLGDLQLRQDLSQKGGDDGGSEDRPGDQFQQRSGAIRRADASPVAVGSQRGVALNGALQRVAIDL